MRLKLVLDAVVVLFPTLLAGDFAWDVFCPLPAFASDPIRPPHPREV